MANNDTTINNNKLIKELILKNLDIKEKEEKTLINIHEQGDTSLKKYKHIKLKPNFSFTKDYHRLKDGSFIELDKNETGINFYKDIYPKIVRIVRITGGAAKGKMNFFALFQTICIMLSNTTSTSAYKSSSLGKTEMISYKMSLHYNIPVNLNNILTFCCS